MLKFFIRSYINLTYRELVTEIRVGLAVALGECDGPVIALMVECIPCHILHTTEAATPIEVVLEVSLDAGPDLDTGTIAGVGHRNIVNVEILHNIHPALVLAKRTDTNTVRTSAVQVLNHNIGAIRFKGDAI